MASNTNLIRSLLKQAVKERDDALLADTVVGVLFGWKGTGEVPGEPEEEPSPEGDELDDLPFGEINKPDYEFPQIRVSGSVGLEPDEFGCPVLVDDREVIEEDGTSGPYCTKLGTMEENMDPEDFYWVDAVGKVSPWKQWKQEYIPCFLGRIQTRNYHRILAFIGRNKDKPTALVEQWNNLWLELRKAKTAGLMYVWPKQLEVLRACFAHEGIKAAPKGKGKKQIANYKAVKAFIVQNKGKPATLRKGWVTLWKRVYDCKKEGTVFLSFEQLEKIKKLFAHEGIRPMKGGIKK